MTLAASHDGGRDGIRALSPRARSSPTIRCHQIGQRRAHGLSGRAGTGPGKVSGVLGVEGDKDEPRAQLRDTKIRCLKETPLRPVAEFVEARSDRLPIAGESWGREATDVLQQQSLRS